MQDRADDRDAPNAGRSADDRLPATMRAVVQRRYGTADDLRVERIDVPTPDDDEVLVEVRAAAVDRGTIHLMTGLPLVARPAIGMRRPRSLVVGLDVAGVVVAAGAKVATFAPGDAVFGVARGSFAEYAVCAAGKLAPKPSAVSFVEAAAVPISGLTAHQGLVDVGRLQASQRVLITGASGGVGTFAVQLARALGAEVTAVCSAGKATAVRALGASRVIDYATTEIDGDGRSYDLMLDIAGNTSLRRLRRMLEPAGTLVIVGGEGPGRWFGGTDRQFRALALSPFVSQRLTMFVATERGSDLVRLSAFLDDGRVTPVIDGTVPLEGAADAIRRLDAGEVTGKVVIDVALGPTTGAAIHPATEPETGPAIGPTTGAAIRPATGPTVRPGTDPAS
jgi:NADPH:quinone reductase-like Zn-dependent oxidoreductase